jgi:HlyD family secretion protein
MKQQLFRRVALDNLAVVERLDTAVQVVGPATSLVVLAAIAFIVTSATWALYGRVPTRVYGEGFLLHEGSIVDVTSMADGQMEHMIVGVGDIVKENDPIARVDQPELKKQQSLLEAKLQELGKKFAQLEGLDEQGSALKHSVFKQARAALSYTIGETTKQLSFYEDKLRADETLLAKGLTTPTTVAETRQKVLDLRDAIFAKQAGERNIAFDALDARRNLESRKYDLGMQVSQTKRELEELQKRIETQSVILAKASGRVIEVKLSDGDAVIRGRSIATLEVAPHGPAGLVADVYIPAEDGKRVQAGMAIKLAPAVTKPEDDGYLEGTVDAVSPFPVSEQSMLRVVRNPNIVHALLKDGPVYEAHVRVTADPHTPSGLHWSSGQGPAIQIASGTPVHALVTVRVRRPIELIIPALARLVTDVPNQDKR